MGTSQPDRTFYVALFVSKYVPPPDRLGKADSLALEVAQRAQDASTEGLFLEYGGLQTWFTYRRLQRSAKPTTGNFSGKARLAQSLRAFEETSVDFRRSVAEGVKGALSSEAQLERPGKRQRTTERADSAGSAEGSDDQQSISAQAIVTESGVITEPTNPVTNHSHLLVTNSPTEDSDDRQSISTQTTATDIDVITVSTNNAVSDHSLFRITDPPALGISAIFPPLLADAIKKKHLRSGWAATITMSFTGALRAGIRSATMMSIEITSGSVGHLAWLLFGAHIGSLEEQRYLLMPTGTKVTTLSTITLRGCRREVILEVFGKVIDEAVKMNPIYKQEIDQGKPLTACIGMEIPSRVSDRAVINLLLEETWASRIKDILFGYWL